MKTRNNLTPAEWILIKAVWARHPTTVREVHDAVRAQTQWAYTTVKTMLERMARKGLLTVERVGPIKRFAPRVARAELLPEALATLLDPILDDSLAPLVTYIANSRQLSAEDIRHLRRLLDSSEPTSEARS